MGPLLLGHLVPPKLNGGTCLGWERDGNGELAILVESDSSNITTLWVQRWSLES